MLIAGPCAIESRDLALRIAGFVKAHGATIFRGGCWKGQNRPIVDGKPAYWGLGIEGINILSHIQNKLNIPCVTEVQSESQLRQALLGKLQYLQVGARHQQNFPLLKALAKSLNKNEIQGVILKRGLGNTVDEWLGSAEHLGGPQKVILCERGVSHFDRTPTTRWRLDFVGVAFIKQHTKYRVIVDPSHGSGDRSLVCALSKAAIQIADGLMVEVHYEPDNSPTDANQTIDFNGFVDIAELYEENILDQDVRKTEGLTSIIGGINYAWEIERRLGLPRDSIFRIKTTTKRFMNFLLKEAKLIGKIEK